MSTPALSSDSTEGGRLLSEGFVAVSEMTDAAGQFRFFVPDVPLGPHQPGPVVVGFIDSGTTSRHPQIDGLVVEERAFVDGPVHDELGHGTSVMLAYLASGALQTSLLSAKVTRDGSGLRASDVTAAFRWLVSKHAKIVNVSLGFDRLTPDVQALCDAIRSARDTFVVAAAGNLGPNVKVYPAACGLDNVVAVGEVRDNRPTATSGAGQIYAAPPRLIGRADFFAGRGMDEARAGRVEEARTLFEESLRASENPTALIQLGLIHAGREQWAEALRRLRRADELAPNQPELLQTVGAVLFALRQLDEAIGYLQRALDLSPQNQRALLNLARAWIAKGDFARAGQALDKAQANDPTDARVGAVRSTMLPR